MVNDDMPGGMRNLNLPHFAVAFVMDVSGSMSPYMNDLNMSFDNFINAAKKNEKVAGILDVAVIKFSDDFAVVRHFMPVSQHGPLNLASEGGTVMAGAVGEAIEIVRRQTHFYNKTTAPYKPWIIVMSDGLPFDEEEVRNIGTVARQRESEGKHRVFALGMGDQWNRATLECLTDRIMHIKTWDFSDFFGWVMKSVAKVSESRPSEDVDVTPQKSLWVV